ncbi:FkbM family methyltransferase [Altericista sp. CCNU0014]|uniref:FkbM family methyltransferase n=1 Tax=Altericista sp. CCNU0014 TaxID=3082949 RepID=UPI00384EFBD9
MSVFLSTLKKHGRLDPIHLTICNVGSRKISSQDEYATGPWSNFLPNLSILGFDADADACQAANEELATRQINWTERHIPLALSNVIGESTLYVTKAPMCSSLYPPNESYLKRFSNLADLVSLDYSVEIEVVTLDQACKDESITNIDFLQIDVQGADLHVLEGASQLLERGILGIQIEVEFSSLYKNQPLFADVDSFLRGYDFSLFDLSLSHRVRACSPIRSALRNGQLLWGDAFYFKDLIQLMYDEPSSTVSPDRIFKLACLADALLFPDYGLELLEFLTINYGKDEQYNFADIIIETLLQFPELDIQSIQHLSIVKNIKGFCKSQA